MHQLGPGLGGHDDAVVVAGGAVARVGAVGEPAPVQLVGGLGVADPGAAIELLEALAAER